MTSSAWTCDCAHIFHAGCVLKRLHVFPNIFLGLALYAIGGWGYVVWGVFLRLVVGLHATWFVNSAAHVWGYRTFETPEGSRNLWWVGLIAWGEGGHNNHHAYQRSARHGLQWWELDATWLAICALRALGLAKDIQLVPAAQLGAAKLPDEAAA